MAPDDLIGSDNDRTNPCSDPAEEEIEKEFFRPPVIFQFSTEHPERQEVEEDMEETSMKKHVRDKLP
jgi:hypothetical protein